MKIKTLLLLGGLVLNSACDAAPAPEALTDEELLQTPVADVEVQKDGNIITLGWKPHRLAESYELEGRMPDAQPAPTIGGMRRLNEAPLELVNLTYEWVTIARKSKIELLNGGTVETDVFMSFQVLAAGDYEFRVRGVTEDEKYTPWTTFDPINVSQEDIDGTSGTGGRSVIEGFWESGSLAANGEVWDLRVVCADGTCRLNLSEDHDLDGDHVSDNWCQRMGTFTETAATISPTWELQECQEKDPDTGTWTTTLYDESVTPGDPISFSVVNSTTIVFDGMTFTAY